MSTMVLTKKRLKQKNLHYAKYKEEIQNEPRDVSGSTSDSIEPTSGASGSIGRLMRLTWHLQSQYL